MSYGENEIQGTIRLLLSLLSVGTVAHVAAHAVAVAAAVAGIGVAQGFLPIGHGAPTLSLQACCGASSLGRDEAYI